MYSQEIKKGNSYESAKRVIIVAIVSDKVKIDVASDFCSVWNIRDNKNQVLTDLLEIRIIRLSKALETFKKNGKNKIAKWIMFLDDPKVVIDNKIIDEDTDLR